MTPREQAVSLLQHYFRLALTRAGVEWDSDFGVELEELVDCILEAAHMDAAAMANAAEGGRL